MKDGTVRSACSRGKLKKYIGTGVKQTDKTWLVMDWVMEKEYGRVDDFLTKEVLKIYQMKGGRRNERT